MGRWIDSDIYIKLRDEFVEIPLIRRETRASRVGEWITIYAEMGYLPEFKARLVSCASDETPCAGDDSPWSHDDEKLRLNRLFEE
jgi:hypothetical protein